MKGKIKLLANICFLVVSLCLFTFGVYAANTVSVNTKGSVTFTATNVYARVSRTVTGYDEELSTVVSTNYSQEINSTTAPEDIETFDALKDEKFIFVDPDIEIVMTFTIENLATTEGRYLYVKLIDNDTTSTTNITKTAENLGTQFAIAPNSSKTISIYMSVDEINQSGSASYDYTIALKNAPDGTILNGTNATFTEVTDTDGTTVVGYTLSGLKTTTATSATVSPTSNIVAMADSTLTDIVIPATYNNLPVTAIDANAFKNNTALTSVVFQEGVTNIGNYAFNSCSNLTSIVLPDSVTSIGNYAFQNCSKLTSLSVPKSVTYGQYIFYNVNNAVSLFYRGTLTDWLNLSFTNINYSPIYYGGNLIFNGQTAKNITIPEGISTINKYAFYKCENLELLEFTNDVTKIGSNAFSYCTGLKKVKGLNVNEIGQGAFYGCSALSEITIGSNLTTIDSFAFFNCSALTYVNYLGTVSDWVSITFSDGTANPLNCSAKLYTNEAEVIYLQLPDELEAINPYAFYGCSSIKTVTIGANTETIGSEVFYNCSNIASVTIGSNISTIGSNAFLGCTNVTKVNYTGTVSDWASITFSNTYSNPIYYSTNLFINDVEVVNAIFSDEIETINYSAFRNCLSLESVTFGANVKTIETAAFCGCANLSGTLNLPTILQTIGSSAFEGCTGFTGNLVIPNSVTSIDMAAFKGCTGFTGDLTIPNSVTEIGDSAFSFCSGFDGSLTLPTNDSYTYIAMDTFEGCEKLSGTLSIPSTITSIGSDAFKGCKGFTGTLTIHDAIVDAGTDAFKDCTGFTELYIGASYTIDFAGSGEYLSPYNEPFTNCCNIGTITVSSENATLYALSSSNMLVYYVEEENIASIVYTTYNVTNEEISMLTSYVSDVRVASGAFDYNKGITNLDFYNLTLGGGNFPVYCPNLETVSFCGILEDVSLGYGDFDGCTNLKSISLEYNKVTSIHGGFEDCVSFDTIYYYGTKEQWDETMSISITFVNEVTVYCMDSSGQVSDSFTI